MTSPTRSARRLAVSASEAANQALETTKDNQFLVTQVLDEMSKLTAAIEILWAQQEAMRAAMDTMDITLAALKQTMLRTDVALPAQFEDAERLFAEKKANLRAAREAALQKEELVNTGEPVENKTSSAPAGNAGYPSEAFVFGG